MFICGSKRFGSVRGTVILVSLCFVAVLGIMLAGYLALTTRAMQLSDRSFQGSLSRQLAEAGIEEALRAFNKNDWSDWTGAGMDVNWTLDTTNKRATATISYPSNKFGQGVTASVKIRVDNYATPVLGVAWSSSKAYEVADVVGYGGMWYRCITPHTNQTPTATGNLAYWVPAPIPWEWSKDITYTMYDLVNHNGTWYRWIGAANSNVTPAPNSVSWTTIPANVSEWSSSTPYAIDSVVTRDGVNYRCISPNTNQSPPNDTYWTSSVNSVSLSWATGNRYTIGALVFNDGTWYYCTTNHTSGSTFAGDIANWSTAPTWTSGTSYAVGELVYRASDNLWYTCKTANNDATFTSSKWVSSAWAASRAYTVGNVVNANGNWWRCTSSHTSSSLFATDQASRWSSAIWAAGTTYTLGRVVLYQGEWWTCAVASSNSSNFPTSDFTRKSFALNGLQYLPKSYLFNDVAYYSTGGSGTWYRWDVNSTTQAPPTNTSYWENALSASWDWDSNDDYNIGDVVYLSGSFYRCIRAHTTSQTPPNSVYWSTEPPFSTYWDENKNYGTNDVVRYRGSWYLNLTGTSTRPGTDDDNWAIAPGTVTPWNSSSTYHVDDVVSSGGNWYRCKKDHTNQSVGNDNTYWVQIAGPAYVWNSATAYAANSHVSYGGVWYRCVAATTANAGHTPNNTAYWTPTWAHSAGVTTGAPVIYAESEITLGDNTKSRTQLRATLDPAPLFPNAASATTTLTINGGTGTVDSYDSELPAPSDTDGDNYVAADAGYAAVLAAGTGEASGTSALLTVGDGTNVRGYAAAISSSSTPFAPRLSYGSSAIIKNVASTPTPNVDLTQLSRSPYIPLYDIQTPIQQTSIPTSLPTTTYPLNLGTPGSPTPSVYYFSSSMNVASGERVNINGPVILRMNGYLLTTSGGAFNVASTGSVVVYATYVLRSYSGAVGFQNLTKDPKRMLLISTNTTSPTTSNYLAAPSGSSKFYGAIYTPNTTSTNGFEVQTGVDFYGALSAREVTFNNESNLHYDTSLRYATFTGVDQPYTVTQWRELDATEQATMP